MTGGPGLAVLTIRYWHWSVSSVLYLTGSLCIFGAIMLENKVRASSLHHALSRAS